MKYILFAIIGLLLGCGDPSKSLKQYSLFNKGAVSVRDFSGYGKAAGSYASGSSDISILYKESPPETIVNIPYASDTLSLHLTKIDLYDDQFKIHGDGWTQYDAVRGVFYTGTVIGEDKSFVSLSVWPGEVSGVVTSSKYGNINIHKNKVGSEEYAIYVASDNDIKFSCLTEDTMSAEVVKTLTDRINVAAISDKCVTIDFELGYSVYNYFNGSVDAATTWMTNIFAAVKSIYLNEGINVKIKSIFVWTTPDPYDQNNGQAALYAFRDKRTNDPNFTADVCHLVIGKTCSGGCSLMGIAYVATIGTAGYKFGMSQPLMTYQPYPTFSWTIEVVTHELGHNLGSPHTQSCSWPGGPIDNCVPQEGNCAPGPHPPKGGGYIMSYCHMDPTVGIQFSNGFGTLSGNAIRNKVASVSLGPCQTSVATCTDGIKNGNEEGVDCGGSCPPCAPVVVSGNLAINKPSIQSTTYTGTKAYPSNPDNTVVQTFPSGNAFDGNMSTFSRTDREVTPWIQVDLLSSVNVLRAVVYTRKDCCWNLSGVIVYADGVPVYQAPPGLVKDSLVISINRQARVIKLSSNNSYYPGGTFMQIAEFKVYGNGDPVKPHVPVCRDTTYDSVIVVKRQICL